MQKETPSLISLDSREKLSTPPLDAPYVPEEEEELVQQSPYADSEDVREELPPMESQPADARVEHLDVRAEALRRSAGEVLTEEEEDVSVVSF